MRASWACWPVCTSRIGLPSGLIAKALPVRRRLHGAPGQGVEVLSTAHRPFRNAPALVARAESRNLGVDGVVASRDIGVWITASLVPFMVLLSLLNRTSATGRKPARRVKAAAIPCWLSRRPHPSRDARRYTDTLRSRSSRRVAAGLRTRGRARPLAARDRGVTWPGLRTLVPMHRSALPRPSPLYGIRIPPAEASVPSQGPTATRCRGTVTVALRHPIEFVSLSAEYLLVTEGFRSRIKGWCVQDRTERRTASPHWANFGYTLQ